MTAPYFGIFRDDKMPEETALGIFFLEAETYPQQRTGWYVRAWAENVGPFPSRALAEAQYWHFVQCGQGIALPAELPVPFEGELRFALAGVIVLLFLEMINWPAVFDTVKMAFQ